MSTNSNKSFPRRVEGRSRQQNTRVSSWLRIKAFRNFRWKSSTMKHMIHMMTMMRMMDENDQDDPRMSHHLFIEPHRRCARTVLSQCQGYV